MLIWLNSFTAYQHFPRLFCCIHLSIFKIAIICIFFNDFIDDSHHIFISFCTAAAELFTEFGNSTSENIRSSLNTRYCPPTIPSTTSPSTFPCFNSSTTSGTWAKETIFASLIFSLARASWVVDFCTPTVFPKRSSNFCIGCHLPYE